VILKTICAVAGQKSIRFNLVYRNRCLLRTHRTLSVIIRRNIRFLRVPKAYSVALVCSVLTAALLRVCALLLKKSSELKGGK
jgi:hypothetical protein